MTDAIGTYSADAATRSRPAIAHWSLAYRLNEHGDLVVADSATRRVQLVVKRGFDVTAATLILVALLPLLTLIALAIKTSSGGPVLFRQVRHGLNGKPFEILKFRTLYADRCDPDGIQQTTVGDDRVTGVGRFLRRWNLDELPQLVNVITGDMSLVGPRPHPISMIADGKKYEEHVSYYFQRLRMKPGITGWAQCNGLRGPTDDPELATARIDHDLAYIRNFSLFLDLKILLRTVAREALGGTGV